MNKNITILLDSSNTSLTVGLAKDNKLIDSISYEAWQTQSEYLVLELDNLLNKYSINREEIKDIVASVGPGSYTGVRIALTVAKTMAVALKIKVKTVSSLQILKKQDEISLCLVNARSGRSYFAVYQGKEAIEKDQIKTNEEVLSYIKEHPDYVICGDVKYLGLEGYRSNIASEMLSLLDDEYVSEILAIKPVYMHD